jgi:large subunit ribosomal protein L18
MTKYQNNRQRRQERVRRKLRAISSSPRLSVFKSNKNIHLQIIDDKLGQTLASFSTLEKGFQKGKNKEIAKRAGEEIAKRALDKGISKVVFDRGCRQYHGVVKTIAESAREAGLNF